MDAAHLKDSTISPKFTKSNRQPTAIVAGGAGFLGSHLCETLSAQNCAVICIDNLSCGSRENIKNLLIKPEFLFIEADINQEMPPLPEGTVIDYIFHLAGTEQHHNRQKISLETLLVNSIGTRNLLELARKHQAKFLLVSTDDFTQGQASASSFANYFGTRSSREQEVTYQEAKRYAEALTFEYFKNYFLDARIARVLDVYGPRMDLNDGTEASALLKQILNGNEQLEIKGDGLSVSHPTFVSDVIFGLVKAMFSPETKGGIFHLINPQKTTVLGLADTIKKVVGRNYETVFLPKEGEPFAFYYPGGTRTQEVLNWLPKVSLADGLEKTIQFFKDASAKDALSPNPLTEAVLRENSAESPNFLSLPKVTGPKISLPKASFGAFFDIKKSAAPSLKPPSVGRSHLQSIIFFSFLSLVILGLVAPALSLVFYFNLGNQRLSQTGIELEKISLSSALGLAEEAENYFQAARSDLTNLGWVFQLLSQKPLYLESQRLLNVEQNLAVSAKYSVMAAQPINQIGEFLTNSTKPETLNFDEKLTQAKVNLESAQDYLSLAEASVGQIQKASLPSWLLPKVAELNKGVEEEKNLVSGLKKTLSVLPKAVGLKGTATYLFLFQDNLQLRPTGGVIKSYGLLSLEGGRIKEFKVDDVSNLDKQLKEKVEPPAEIKKYLNSNFWNLEQANWNPSFDQASKDIEWFFEKETGEKVDGVVALDTTVLRRLLQTFGSVEIPAYQEKVDSKNIFEKVSSYASGNKEKGDFLGAVGKAVFEKLVSSKKEVWPYLMTTFKDVLKSKHLLISSFDDNLAKVIQEGGWDGRLIPGQNGNRNDYLMTVDANLGKNEANLWVESLTSYSVTFNSDGTAEAKLKLTYRTKDGIAAPKEGVYKDYLRVFVPLGAQFTKIDAEEDLKVKTAEENGKEVFGFYFELSSGKSKTFTLFYKLPLIVKANDKYSITVDKQPGKEDLPFDFNLTLPKETLINGTNYFGENKGNSFHLFQNFISTDTITIETKVGEGK